MISREQEERFLFITVHKNIMDWQSGMVEARRKGIAEGYAEGLAEGRVEANIETAKNLLSDGIEPERVAAYTGLSLDTVLKQRQDK